MLLARKLAGARDARFRTCFKMDDLARFRDSIGIALCGPLGRFFSNAFFQFRRQAAHKMIFSRGSNPRPQVLFTRVRALGWAAARDAAADGERGRGRPRARLCVVRY